MKRFLVFFVLLMVAVIAYPANIALQWDIPTARVDGAPLSPSEIQGFRLYYVVEGVETVVNLPGTATSHVVNDLPPGTYEFRIATVTSDQEGPASPVETVVVQADVSAPVITRIIVERCTPEGVCTQEVIK